MLWFLPRLHYCKQQRQYLSLILIYFLIYIQFNLVPGEPQDFKVVKVTSNSIELEWKAPKRDEHSSSNNIKGYEIHYFKVNPSSPGPSSGLNDIKETQIFKRKTNDIKKLKYTLTDLEANSLYKIQIFAYNMKGDGQRSNPLLVNTLEEGPSKPENIRSEIHNDNLHIKWQAPSSSPNGGPVASVKSNQQISGYRIYFNNEKYEVDGQTTQITFQRPKWGLYSLFFKLFQSIRNYITF